MSNPQNLSRSVLTTAIALVALGCGGTSTSRESARDQATSLTCATYDRCQNGFGAPPDHAYTSRDSCEVDWRAKWETGWPPAECDGKIDGTQLDTCLSAIRGTDCTSLLDIATTIYVKCSKMKVCGAPADGGT
jgi:Family of unknown function (DUF6184)